MRETKWVTYTKEQLLDPRLLRLVHSNFIKLLSSKKIICTGYVSTRDNLLEELRQEPVPGTFGWEARTVLISVWEMSDGGNNEPLLVLHFGIPGLTEIHIGDVA